MTNKTNVDRIPLVDLQDLHRPLLSELTAAAGRVLRSGHYILGPEVAAFERELSLSLGATNVVGVSSGTDALLALLMATDIGPGDEVITTPYSFVATCEAIVRLGARPVFADVEAETLNLDPRCVAHRFGPRTKAVLVVHLFGRPARLDDLRALCNGHGVPLLEDAAQAVGARGVGLGAGATVSFFPSKNLGGFGDGGAVLTNDSGLAERLRSVRNHGTVGDKMRHECIGGNFRLDELQAALLRVKLPWLPRWTDARRRVARAYAARLAGLPIGLPPPDDGSVWNQFVIRVSGGQRGNLRTHLQDRGVASAIYYPTPLHLQPALLHFGGRPGDLPNAERAALETLALPMSPSLTAAELDRIADALSAFF